MFFHSRLKKSYTYTHLLYRESSFNMTREVGDEDIEGEAPKIFKHLKGGALKKLLG